MGFVVILVEFLNVKKSVAPPSPIPPFVFLNQDNLNVNNADYSFIKVSNYLQADQVEKIVGAEDYLFI